MQRKDLDIFPSPRSPSRPGHNNIAGGHWVPDTRAATRLLMVRSNEPKVHCCYFAGHRRAPAVAQAQKPWVTKDDVQKVVTIITGDKAKTQTYCEIQSLGEQMERAYEKRNLKLVDELLQKMDALEETLGPEYIALMDGLADIDPENDKLGAEIISVFDPLDRLCTR